MNSRDLIKFNGIAYHESHRRWLMLMLNRPLPSMMLSLDMLTTAFPLSVALSECFYTLSYCHYRRYCARTRKTDRSAPGQCIETRPINIHTMMRVRVRLSNPITVKPIQRRFKQVAITVSCVYHDIMYVRVDKSMIFASLLDSRE